MSAKFTVTGDGSGAVKVIDSVAAALNKTGKAAEGAAKSTRQLEREAQRIKEAVDPTEKLNRQYRDLKGHVDAGRLTMDQATAAATKYRREIEGVAPATEKSFGASALSGLKGYLLGLGTISGAIALIRSEIQATVDLNDRIARTKMTAAESEAGLRRVIATDPQRQSLIDATERIAREKSLPLPVIHQAAASGYGAIGDAGATIASLEEATRQTRDAEGILENTRGIGFVMKSGAASDPREAAGYLNQALAASPIDDKKVPAALAKVVGSYLSPINRGDAGSAGAALSVISQFAGDTEGERSRTAAIELSKQTRNFFKKNGRKYGLNPEDFDSQTERLDLLTRENNAAMAIDFVGSNDFSATTEAGIAGMFLTPEGRAQFRDERNKMNSAAARIQAADWTADFIAGGALQEAKQTEDAISSGAEMFDLGSEYNISSENREKFLTVWNEALGGPRFMASLALLKDTGWTLDRDEAIAQVKGLEYGASVERTLGTFSDSQEKAMTQLQNMASHLEEINKRQSARLHLRDE